MKTALLAGSLAWLALAAGAAEPPVVLIENFTSPLPDSAEVRCSTVFEGARQGLAMAQLDFRLHPQQRRAQLSIDRPIPRQGQLRLWVQGNPAGGHDLQVIIWHARVTTDDSGNPRYEDRREVGLERVPLDFEGWRDLAFTVKDLPAGHSAGLRAIVLHARNRESAMEGTVRIDDLRCLPQDGKPLAALQHGLIGPSARSFGNELDLFFDCANFSSKSGKAQIRVHMTDRNENAIFDQDFAVDLAAGERQELRLALKPENLHLYLPPFRLSGDILSPDLPAVAGRFEHRVAMANADSLWEDFSDVHGRWASVGWENLNGFTVHNHRQWIGWLMGEGPRASTVAQANARLSRVELPPAAAAGAEAHPTGRFALRVDYTDNAEVYNVRSRVPRQPGNAHTGDRFLPGNAVRAGFWTHGDNSGALVQAVFLDYSDMADFTHSGWKRTWDGTRDLCRLDFTGWRRVEVTLPGAGLGSNERNGSTDRIDYPLELSALRIQSWRDNKEKADAGDRAFGGTVLFGPITVLTQQAASESLVLHLAYDDPNHLYAAKAGAWVILQNASLTASRKTALSWVALDRDNKPVAKGTLADAALAPRALHSARIDLAGAAPGFKDRAGPFRLRVTAYDKEDAAVSAERDLLLAAPDSRVLLADFETGRAYFAFGRGATPIASTSAEQARNGRRALAVDWDRNERRQVTVALDPPIPGPAVDISLWVRGDASGVFLYPVFGGPRGVPHGAEPRQYNLLGGRADDGRQNGVFVDWEGWREIRFRLPPVPPTWAQQAPVWGYVPSYPLSLLLAVDAQRATREGGRIFVDDIRVATHLPPAERLELKVEQDGAGNILPPDGQLRVTAASHETAATRTVTLRGRLRDWRGNEVDRFDETVPLPPGTRHTLSARPRVPDGVYALHVELLEGDRVLREFRGNLARIDPQPLLGGDWPVALRDEWRLRQPLRSLYTFVDEDWDWIENHPGNLQTQSVRQRAADVRKQGGEPWMLLGYSAYFAAGQGYEEFMANAYVRRSRDIGHAIDVFLVPERIEDWDHYVCELMRDAGEAVDGWVLWNNPDARGGSLAVAPERFARMAEAANRWRRAYCPERPLLIGGMTPETAIPYLDELRKLDALRHLTGVNVRMDVGVRSPEDAEVPKYVTRLRKALQTDDGVERQILLTDLDWAVEAREDGLDEFTQAAYLIRAALLMAPLGILPEVAIRNGDSSRLGLGVAYRESLSIPPHAVALPEFRVKAAWLGLVRTRQWLEKLRFAAVLEVSDTVPGRTRALQFRQPDGQPAVFLWRNDEAGIVSFAQTSLRVTRAEDMLGSPVPEVAGGYAVGKLPVLFLLEAGSAATAEPALSRIRVRDGDDFAWPQRVLSAFTPAATEGYGYAATQGAASTLSGTNPGGEDLSMEAVVLPAGGSERFTSACVPGSDLILRKRFLLDGEGQEAEVWVNGAKVGDWNLRSSDPQLSRGFRESLFVVPRAALGDAAEAAVELRYRTAANTVAWRAFAGGNEPYPLTAVGAVHVDQTVSHPRLARNMAGEMLRIGDERFAGGIGIFAPSLREIALNGQFRRFRAKVGVDAATEGRGSVVFEVYADGQRIWNTPVMSGLDAAREVDLDVTGIHRLRLVVTDGGDGNRFDAADWCDAALYNTPPEK